MRQVSSKRSSSFSPDGGIYLSADSDTDSHSQQSRTCAQKCRKWILSVHFKNGAALNYDGTWKHGHAILTKEQKKWLLKHGWTLPKNETGT